jgi:hypothetical protein
MQKFGKHVALSLSQGGSEAEEFMRKARAYCEERGYVLWNGDIYQDQEPCIALDWVKEVMNSLTIRTLLIPTIQSIHPTDMGYVLNFLIEAQERHVDIVCLEPVSARLNQYTLAIVPWTQEHQAAGIAPLPDVIRSLRLR